jgi:hypothetical protein
MGQRIAGVLVALFAAGASIWGCSGDREGPPRFDHAYPEYAQLLDRHVDADGLVDYAGLKSDSALLRRAGENLRALSGDSLAHCTELQRMAYWINAYNLVMLEAVVAAYPVDSIQDIISVLDRPHYKVGGRTVSLNDVEKKILRREFTDPRVLFALCRASLSSPALRRAPYRADSLRAQLRDAAFRFLTDPSRNVFDPQQHYASLSAVFTWYEREFQKVYWSEIPSDQPDNVRAVFNFIADVLPDSLGRFLHSTGVTWSYLPYDWSLNDRNALQRSRGN